MSLKSRVDVFWDVHTFVSYWKQWVSYLMSVLPLQHRDWGAQGQNNKSLADIQVICPMICPQLWQLHKFIHSGGEREQAWDWMSPPWWNKQGRSGSEPTDRLFMQVPENGLSLLSNQANKGQFQFCAWIFAPQQHRRLLFFCCHFISGLFFLCLSHKSKQILCAVG